MAKGKKSEKKTIVKVAGKKEGKKRQKKRNNDSFSNYLYKVLKQVHPDVGISSKAMTVMDNFVVDVFERLSSEAASVIAHSPKDTLQARDYITAARLVLPGELAKHAVSEATKSITKYSQAVETE